MPTPALANETADKNGGDTSAIGTVALFAGVIGVVIGWVLREVTAYLKEKARAAREKQSAEQTRVLEAIHTAENLSGAANGLGLIFAAVASGKTLDRDQLVEVTRQYNENRARLSRFRLEIAILGPDWVGDKAKDVENAANALQTALTHAERKPSKPAFDALLVEVDNYRNARQALIDVATAKYA